MSFAFKLDPKKMAIYKTEATLRKKIEEYVAKSGVFKSSELKELKYSMKDFLEEWKKQLPIVEAEELAKIEASPNHPESRITPDHITRLGTNEIFVFGSNEHGLHYGGAAKVAYEMFGAIMGQGNGLQGKSYGIDSMSGLSIMGERVKEFCEFAKAHPEKHFLVTPIGCGIAGYSEADVAPLFEICRDLKNVSLPAAFWDIIGWPLAKEYDLVSEPNEKGGVMTNKELENLREFCVNRWPEKMGATHGVEHWDRVAMFGKMLYQEGADKDVIACFAYLHDSERKDNGIDEQHGFRASLFIDTLRDSYLKPLSDEQIATLKKACKMHTVVPRTDDITVNICFDADRMDLLRVGILPVPERMATKRGAELVGNSNYGDNYYKLVEQIKRRGKDVWQIKISELYENRTSW